jgi:hypothetical protein
MRLRGLPLALVLSVAFGSAQAAVIGTNTPAQAITPARVAALPAKARAAWEAYLSRSEAQGIADRVNLAQELKPGQPAPPPPEEKAGGKTMPLDRDACRASPTPPTTSRNISGPATSTRRTIRAGTMSARSTTTPPSPSCAS